MKIFNRALRLKTIPSDFVSNSHLSEKDTAKLKKLDVEKIVKVDSRERVRIFSKLIGKEKAEYVNTRFETDVLLSNEKEGMLSWAKNTDMEEKFRQEVIKRITRLKKPLGPEEKEVFMRELAELKLGIGVTEEEIATIVELSQKAEKARTKIENGGSSAEYEKAHNVLEAYVEELKKS